MGINLKSKIASYIPRWVKDIILLGISHLRLIQFFYNDYIKYRKSAFRLNKNHTKDQIKARITIHYHSIEKGLSHKNIRLGFGKHAIKQLLKDLDDYKKNSFPLEDIRYRTGCSVLLEYIKLHEEANYDISEIKSMYKSIVGNFKENLGGCYQLNKEEVLKYRNSDFKQLSDKRFSVRNFSDELVDIQLINKAIEIAMKTPSVCNRQPWNVYVVKNKELQKDLLSLQGGLRGLGDNMDTLIAITAKNSYFGGPEERNQGFIDGGLFSMSLLYSLEYMGLASCALNADFNKKTDDQIRKILDIKVNENIILFIAVGNYPSTFKVPKSQRESHKEITKYFMS